MGKGTVLVELKLLVERDGRVSDVQVVRVYGVEARKQEKYEQEARRIAFESGKIRWKPGYQDGKRLRTYALVPILFKRGL